MQTITVCALKGGSGKTTAVLLLAVHAHHLGKRAAVIDMNADQGNIRQWQISRGKLPGPEIIAVETLTRDIKLLEHEGFDYTFIDTPPGIDDSAIVESSVAASQAVLVPVRPSVLDLGTVDSIVEICNEHRKPFAFLLCDVTTQWKSLNDTAEKALAEIGPVLAARIPHRMAYVNALTVGKTGPEIDKSLQSEVAAVWKEVNRFAAKRERRHV
jgi:chromosome partitioning protein